MQTRMPVYKKCDWDSNFFGYGVAEVVPSEPAINLACTLSQLRVQNIRLVYYRVPTESQSLLTEAEAAQGFYAGGQITYERSITDVGALVKSSRTITEYPHLVPSDELKRLALRSGEYSRYKNDSHFTSEQFEQLYTTWIQKCVDKRMADRVFTALDGTKIIGFVAVQKKGSESSIGLISVDEAYQGQGVGADLVNVALRSGQEAGCERHTVITYIENKAACRMFEKCGYKPSSKLSCFHFWLE